jgi:NUMOD3 motif
MLLSLLLWLLHCDANMIRNNSTMVTAWIRPITWNAINTRSRLWTWTNTGLRRWLVTNHRHTLSTSDYSSSHNSFTSTDVRKQSDIDYSNTFDNSVFDDSMEPTAYINVTNNSNDSLQKNNQMKNNESFWVRNNDMVDEEQDDVPRLTENGGYSHTQASRAKISAANKGKVPWNKGLNRTDEVKARIAAGVRAKNRERFLQKLQEMNMTEEEYDEQKRKERTAKEAERRARRTENGGYRPTEETKRKISNILKQKFAAGEIKPRPINPIHIRRGFTHSDETRQKISESLRKRWASDPEYRAKMIDVSTRVNTKQEIRQKISESLRNKWQCDDTFRNEMMDKIASRKRRVENADGTYEICHHDENHRAKISAAMKAKWQDMEYREKTLQSLALRRTQHHTSKVIYSPPLNTPSPRTSKKSSSSINSVAAKTETKDMPLQPNHITSVSQPRNTSDSMDQLDNILHKKGPKVATKKVKNDHTDTNDIVMIQPVQPRTVPRKKVKKIGGQEITSDADDDSNILNHSSQSGAVTNDNMERFSVKVIPKNNVLDNILPLDVNNIVHKFDLLPDVVPIKKDVKSSSTTATASTGNVELLKTERRDLYDLLYGDDTDVGDGDDEDDENHGDHMKDASNHHLDDHRNNNDAYVDEYNDQVKMTGSTSPTLASIFARLEDDNLDTFDPYGLDDF